MKLFDPGPGAGIGLRGVVCSGCRRAKDGEEGGPHIGRPWPGGALLGAKDLTGVADVTLRHGRRGFHPPKPAEWNPVTGLSNEPSFKKEIADEIQDALNRVVGVH